MAREDQEQARSAASAPAPFLPSPRQDLQVTKQGTPFYKHWALWVGIGAVLAGTATAIAVSQAGGTSAAPSGEYVLDFR